MRSTGSSTVRRGNATGFTESASVSPISTSGKPATMKRSPALTESTSIRPMPENVMSWLSFRRSGLCPSSSSHSATCSPRRSVPCITRPMARRPRYSEASRLVTIACAGASGSPVGAGIASTMAWKSGVRSSPSPGIPIPETALPSRAIAEITGNSIACSSASRSRKSW